MSDLKWQPTSQGVPPLHYRDDCGYPSSGPVLGWDGQRMAVVAFRQYDECCDVACRTECSEGWDITGTITHWAHIAPPTEGQD